MAKTKPCCHSFHPAWGLAFPNDFIYKIILSKNFVKNESDRMRFSAIYMYKNTSNV